MKMNKMKKRIITYGLNTTIGIFYLIIGTCSVKFLLSLFKIKIPLLVEIIIGGIGGGIATPLAIIAKILQLCGINIGG